MMSKRCARCAKTFPFGAFHRQSSSKDGLQAWCKKCQRAYDQANRKAGTRKTGTPEQRRKWNLSRRYALTPQEVAELKEQQGGVCAICGKVPERWVVDHCHATGKVRGLLCHRCNIHLPIIEDAAFVDAAQRYLLSQ